ncbi:KR domain-containing protein [Daldinia grandis]|nr:KR domain-containing protein [Daldinia grandis]
MSYDDWAQCVEPKVLGTWNLHNATVSRGLNLDLFVLFSSISGIVGQRGQANYSGANTFLDSFAQYRHCLGLNASAVNIGVMLDHGYVADNPIVRERLLSQGIFGIRIAEMLDALYRCHRGPTPSHPRRQECTLQTMSLSSSRFRFRNKLPGLLVKPVEGDNEIDINRTLQEMEFDSLVAVEMSSWWKSTFGFDISVLEMLGAGSMKALGEKAVQGLKERFGASDDGDDGAVKKYTHEEVILTKMP